MTGEPIRVLAYNVKILPSPFGDADDVMRAAVIAENILGMQPVVDVVCLQEVFNEDVRSLLVQTLDGAFPHQVPKCHDGTWFSFDEDSGLFFASRFPIRERGDVPWHGFREFDATAPFTSDYFTDKGVFGAALDVGERWGDDATLGVFQTHLQSDHTIRDPHPEVRARQLQECERFMQRFLARTVDPERTCGLFVGDFNVVGERTVDGVLEETDEHRALMQSEWRPVDLFREAHPEAPGYTWDAPANTRIDDDDEDDRERLDYVFGMGAVPGRAGESPTPLHPVEATAIEVHAPRTTTFGDLSDHYGVLASVRPAAQSADE